MTYILPQVWKVVHILLISGWLFRTWDTLLLIITKGVWSCWQILKLENHNFFPTKRATTVGQAKNSHHVPWGNSESFRAYFFEGWLSTTSIIYGVAQSQERRCRDLGRWVFGSTWVVPKAHGYWKWKQTAETTKGVKQSGAYFVGHSRKTKATICSYCGSTTRKNAFCDTYSATHTFELSQNGHFDN